MGPQSFRINQKLFLLLFSFDENQVCPYQPREGDGFTRVLLLCKAWRPRCLLGCPPDPFFFYIHSTCCITVLDIPGFITRTAFWQAGNKVIQMDMIKCFYFVSFVSPLVLFFPLFLSFFLSRAQLFDIFTAVIVGHFAFFLFLQTVFHAFSSFS
jgi:hypothetical protein